MKLSHWLAAIPLLGLMAFLMAGPALRQTVTIDEVAHIGAGLSYVQRQDLRLNGEHPPLAKVLAAVPLALSGTRADYGSISWTFSDKFFPAYLAQWVFGEWVLGRWNPRQQTVVLARVPMIVLTIVLGLIIYWCALRLGGLAGALLSLSAYISFPVFLTFGPLVLTDIPVALFSVLTLAGFASLWRSPGRRSVAFFSSSLAAALLTKFSAPLVLIAIAIAIRYSRFRPLPLPFDSKRFQMFKRGTVLALVAVYGSYLILSWNQPMDVQHRIGEGTVANAIGRVLMPGWLYLRGMTMVLFTSSRPAFLLGESYPQGLPVYFPLLMLWKSPPGFLGLLVVAALCCLTLRRTPGIIPESERVLWRVLWISCIVLTAACLLSRLNISFRHFTVPLALIILLLAPLPNVIRSISAKRRFLGQTLAFLTVVCASASVMTAVSAYPHFLPYTNALAAGTPAYRLYGDSNLDWNHALGEIEPFAERNGISQVLVDSYGLSDPAVEVKCGRLWDCQSPAAEDAGKWAVVSANALLESHNCAWLIPHIRQTLAGGSLYAVRLPSAVPEAGSRGGPPLPANHRRLFALPINLRAILIDVTRDPERLPEAFAELESRLAPAHITDDLYPPKEAVQWPWD